MVILCDSSAVVAGLIEEHPHYQATIRLIERIMKGKVRGALATHSPAEIYSALTNIPCTNPISPLQAGQAIKEKILPNFQIVEVSLDDYQKAVERVSSKNLRSGAVYGSLIFQVALKSHASCLVTWNLSHFERLSHGEIPIKTPDKVALQS